MPAKLQFGLHVGFLVNPNMHEQITQVAKVQGCTMSDVIRAALERHLFQSLPGPDAVQASPERSPAEP